MYVSGRMFYSLFKEYDKYLSDLITTSSEDDLGLGAPGPSRGPNPQIRNEGPRQDQQTGNEEVDYSDSDISDETRKTVQYVSPTGSSEEIMGLDSDPNHLPPYFQTLHPPIADSPDQEVQNQAEEDVKECEEDAKETDDNDSDDQEESRDRMIYSEGDDENANAFNEVDTVRVNEDNKSDEARANFNEVDDMKMNEEVVDYIQKPMDEQRSGNVSQASSSSAQYFQTFTPTNQINRSFTVGSGLENELERLPKRYWGRMEGNQESCRLAPLPQPLPPAKAIRTPHPWFTKYNLSRPIMSMLPQPTIRPSFKFIDPLPKFSDAQPLPPAKAIRTPHPHPWVTKYNLNRPIMSSFPKPCIRPSLKFINRLPKLADAQNLSKFAYPPIFQKSADPHNAPKLADLPNSPKWDNSRRTQKLTDPPNVQKLASFPNFSKSVELPNLGDLKITSTDCGQKSKREIGTQTSSSVAPQEPCKMMSYDRGQCQRNRNLSEMSVVRPETVASRHPRIQLENRVPVPPIKAKKLKTRRELNNLRRNSEPNPKDKPEMKDDSE